MILCDIGNTSYHFLENEKEYKKDVTSFHPETIQQKVFYICVHPEIKKTLKKLPNWIDISPYIDTKHYYPTMGVDRIVACEAIFDGLILDAGSAITVDIVTNGIFEGGFIYPGVYAMQQTYKNISKALDYSFNFECDFDIMPKNSQDAISYGYLKLLYNEVVSKNKEIFLTGGDAQKFLHIFPNAKVKKYLLFDGMKKIIKKANLC
ncbi:Pantothenate kinase type III, CoaX-like [hydrothermal vent metagenome]|uniref:Type III pantothenate kinase n=1 Tax=hydrothermal vent metagenome TaxID=652676 RepID=A0A1W1D378_9ZZZZ